MDKVRVLFFVKRTPTRFSKRFVKGRANRTILAGSRRRFSQKNWPFEFWRYSRLQLKLVGFVSVERIKIRYAPNRHTAHRCDGVTNRQNAVHPYRSLWLLLFSPIRPLETAPYPALPLFICCFPIRSTHQVIISSRIFPYLVLIFAVIFSHTNCTPSLLFLLTFFHPFKHTSPILVFLYFGNFPFFRFPIGFVSGSPKEFSQVVFSRKQKLFPSNFLSEQSPSLYKITGRIRLIHDIIAFFIFQF